MKKILIPTDFSDLADFAYDLADKIARHTDAEIHVLSIVPASTDVFFDKKGNLKDSENQDLTALYEQKEVVSIKMDKWLEGKEKITNKKVKIGRLEHDILQYVKQNNIDLVVMGTSGVFTAEQSITGSHTGHIAMKCSVPLLSLKCDRSEMEVRDLLLVGDFHETEKIDLSVLKTLQNVFDAKLNLLKVNTAKDFEPQREVISRMQKFVDVNELGDAYFNVYCDNSVEKGIVNFSTDTGIDFVFIGTHQRGEFSRLFKRSISNDLVNHIWQPVLTFPV